VVTFDVWEKKFVENNKQSKITWTPGKKIQLAYVLSSTTSGALYTRFGGQFGDDVGL
jgi:hypothetical protein